jgi:predicted nuclease of predicted toxin-antitoxin system
MKFLADMGISLLTVEWLRAQDHDALHVRDAAMQRAADEIILTKARDEQRIVLTLDLDFGYLLAVSGADLPSVIIFRLGNQTAEVVTRRLQDTLACCTESLLNGAIVTVTEEAIRVRDLPIVKD